MKITLKITIKILIILWFGFNAKLNFAETYFNGAKAIAEHIQLQLKQAENKKATIYKPDFTSDFEKYLQKAKSGDANAQYHVGQMYQHSKLLKPDHVKSAYWLEKAADQKHILAAFEIATLYKYGIGVSINNDKSMHYLHIAAEQGHAHAQSDLSLAYLFESALSKDDGRAIYWARKSAEQEIPASIDMLASMYLDGMATKKNVKAGIELKEKLALMGYVNEYFNISVYFLNPKNADKNPIAYIF